MDLIENNTYRYIAVGFGGLFLVPQIIHGYRRGSLEDVSTITIFFILFTSLLWAYYMYEMKYTLYVYISGFVSLNAIILILMQLRFYYKRFKRHVITFETKPKQEPKPEPKPEPAAVPAQVPIILQMPQVQTQIPEPVTEEIVRVDIADLKTEPTVI